MIRHRSDARHRRSIVLLSRFFWLAVFLTAMAALPARAGVLRLTQSAGLDQLPQINRAGQVVWEGSDGQHTAIYLWDGSSVRQLTSDDRDNHSPQLNDAGQVAWSTNYGDISFWDGASIRSIAHNGSVVPGLRLNQAGQIVWVGSTDYVDQIFLWDGASVRQLSHAALRASSPSLNNHGEVVWLGDGAGNPLGDGWYVNLWDGTTARLLSRTSKDNWAPQVNDAGQAAWQGKTPDGLQQQIYFWDGGNIRILPGASPYHSAQNPQLNQSGQVAWEDLLSGGWALFLWDGTTVRSLMPGQSEPLGLQLNNAGQILWEEEEFQQQTLSIDRWDGTSLQEIARYDTRRFPAWGGPAQNDAGQIVWSARGEIYRYTPPSPGSVDLSPTPVVGSDPSTGLITLPSPAPAGGTVVSLTSSDSLAAQVPASVTVPAGATTASFAINTKPVPRDQDVILTAAAGGATWTTTLRVWSFGLDAIQLDTSSIAGGEIVRGSVRFRGVAPEAGAVAVVTSDHPEVVAPSAPTVSADPGSDHAGLLIRTNPVATATTVTLSVTYGGETRRVPLLIRPLSLTGVVINATRVQGRVSPGDSTSGYVTLDGPVHQKDVVVTLTNDQPGLVQTPGSVTVSPGSASAGFSIRVAPVLAPITVQITASYGSVSRTAQLQVDPVRLDEIEFDADVLSGGVPALGYVRFMGEPPVGTRIALSTERPDIIAVPSQVEVPGGASTVQFRVTTKPVTATVRARVFVSFNGQKQAAWLTLLPFGLTSFTLVPDANSDSGEVLAVLVLTGPAPLAGAAIRVQQVGPNGSVQVDTVTVPAGASLAAVRLKLIARDMHNITASFAGAQIEARWQWSPLRLYSAQITFPQSWIAGGHSAVGTFDLRGEAPDGGLTFGLFSSAESVLRVPASVTVPVGQRTAPVPVSTSPVTGDTLVTISTRGGTDSQVWVLPSGVLSVSVDSDRVTGGRSATGTVTLTDPAPAEGRVVPLLSANPTLASVPQTVIVPPGATTARFPIATMPVAAISSAAIAATEGARVRVAVLTVLPPSLASLAVSLPEIRGGEATTGMVTLSDPAPAEGLVINLQTDNIAYCILPESVMVPPGSTTATFPILTDRVTATTVVHVFASRGNDSQAAALTLLP